MTQSSYSFTVQQIPPSRNHYVNTTRSGGHKTAKAECFAKEIWAMGLQARQGGMGFQRCRVEITLHMRISRILDIDNAPKMVLDGLRDAGFYADDRVVRQMEIKREDVEFAEQECTSITIQEL